MNRMLAAHIRHGSLPAHKRTAAWQDIDPVVNSTITAFLLRFDIALPAMQDYFDTIIAEKTFASKYYHDDIAVMYFMTKAYRGDQSESIKEAILNRRNARGYWHSPLATAQAITALLSLKEEPALLVAAIQYILDTEKDGRWPKTPLYIESRSSGKAVYSDCDAYVSACCIEALQAYSDSCGTVADQNQSAEYIFMQRTIIECKSLFVHSGKTLQVQIADMLEKILRQDAHSTAIMMPYYFFEHMAMQNYTADNAQALAVATIVGWIGYTIIDKTLDGEETIDRLPLSVKCIREAYSLFQLSTAESAHHARVKNILDGIERSVLWEHNACKLMKNGSRIILPETVPDYGDYACLAQKSLGYALAPIIMCLNRNETDQANIIESFFRHYLIARQLNDDAHDWLADLKQGFFNSASVLIIQGWRTASDKSMLDLATEQAALQKLFWERYIDTISNIIIVHCQKARAALAQLTIVTDTVFLEVLLLPLEQAALQAVSERNKTLRFLMAIE